MKLYYFLGRLLRPFGLAGLWAFSHLTRMPRVRIVVRNEHNEILLVKSWLGGDEWGFPGGGVGRRELPEAAACRELEEETGLAVTKNNLEFIGVIHSWGHDEMIYSLQTSSNSLPVKPPSPFEIQEAAWFSIDTLPRLGTLAKEITEKVVVNR